MNCFAHLTEDFFARSPLLCAPELVGCILCGADASGVIIETEAYLAADDPACHTFHRPSARKFVAEQPPGAAYVYMNYGVHWLLNFLCLGGSPQTSGFVLLRALSPLSGHEVMARRRQRVNSADWCSGPGKLTRALGLDGSLHGRALPPLPAAGPYLLGRPADLPPPEVLADVRIGISKAKDYPWRFLHASHLGEISVPVRGLQ